MVGLCAGAEQQCADRVVYGTAREAQAIHLEQRQVSAIAWRNLPNIPRTTQNRRTATSAQPERVARSHFGRTEVTAQKGSAISNLGCLHRSPDTGQ